LSITPEQARRIAGEWLPVAVILLLALWLRAHQLGRESVWYDEYITIAKLQPGLAATLREQVQTDWFMVPVYHMLQYAWAAVFGPTAYASRWLSILFGVAAIPVLYLLARDVYGRAAGLFAITLMALSPYYIFHSQGIRSYALALFLGLLSGWLLLRATRGGGRGWWLAQGVVTALLLWTHLLGALILAPQGLYLLLFHHTPWRRFFVWCGFQLAVVAGVVLWLSTLSGGAGSPPVERLPFSVVPQTLLMHDDGPLASLEYLLPKEASEEDIPPRLRSLMGLRESLGFQSLRMRAMSGLGVAYGFLAGMAVAAALLPLLRRRQPSVQPQAVAYAMLWWVLPVLLLYGLMFATSRALFEQRFAIFGLPLLFVLAAGGLMSLPGRALRIAAAACVLGLLSVQTAAYEVMPVRHGYLPAAEHIKAHAQPGDAVIQHLLYQQWLFSYNLGGDHDLDLLASDSVDELYAKTEAEAQARGSVWVVLLSRPKLSGGPPDQEGLAEDFAAGLAARGMRYETRVFPGMQNIHTFRCYPPEAPAAT